MASGFNVGKLQIKIDVSEIHIFSITGMIEYVDKLAKYKNIALYPLINEI